VRKENYVSFLDGKKIDETVSDGGEEVFTHDFEIIDHSDGTVRIF